MKKESNARFLGIIIDGPLKVYKGDNGGYSEKELQCKGCMGACGRFEEGPDEPDPCDLARDYEEMSYGSDAPTEYDPS